MALCCNFRFRFFCHGPMTKKVEVEPVETRLDFGNKPVPVFDNFSTTLYTCMGWV